MHVSVALQCNRCTETSHSNNNNNNNYLYFYNNINNSHSAFQLHMTTLVIKELCHAHICAHLPLCGIASMCVRVTACQPLCACLYVCVRASVKHIFDSFWLPWIFFVPTFLHFSPPHVFRFLLYFLVFLLHIAIGI